MPAILDQKRGFEAMRNVIILGSGRSGTSMVAGLLAKSGYFMGEYLWSARQSNPKGFFEDKEINQINEDLLDPIAPKRFKFFGKEFFRDRPLYWDRWLTKIALDKKIPPPSNSLIQRMCKATQNTPFCFKDPRFSYTLPVWRPFLKDAVYVCVFRHPANTAKSILKECRDVERLRKTLTFSFTHALKVWEFMYNHILEFHQYEGKWLFLHYDQVVYKQGADRLQEFTGAKLDYSIIDPSLRRSSSNHFVPTRVNKIYDKLCCLAGYELKQ